MAYRLFRLDRPVLRPAKEKDPWIYGVWDTSQRYERALLESGIAEKIDYFTNAENADLSPECRPIHFFPSSARQTRYDGLLAGYPANTALLSLRARYAPQASVVAGTDTLSEEWQWHELGLSMLFGLWTPYDAIFCISRAARQAVERQMQLWAERFRQGGFPARAFPGRLEIIPWGVDLPPKFSKKKSRRILGWKDGETVLLSLGRLSAEDKADARASLVPIAQAIRRSRIRNIRIVFAGADPTHFAAKIHQFAATLGIGAQVTVYANKVDTAMRAHLYAASDVFFSLADNVQESLGLAVLEAMSYGLPVVASDWNGYRDSVVHAQTGYRIPTSWWPRWEDLDALAPVRDPRKTRGALARRTVVDAKAAEEAFRQVLSRPRMRRALGEAGRSRVERHFTWDRVMTRHALLWRQIRRRVRDVKPPAILREYAYGRIFEGHPTRAISKDTLVRASPADFRRSARSLLHILPEPSREHIQKITACVDRSALTIGECLDRFSQEGPEREAALSHILVAAKYGLLSFVHPSSSRKRS